MNIQLVPRVCKQLADQANCEKVVEICGDDADLDFCTAKIVSKTFVKAIGDPEPLKVVKGLYGFGLDIYQGGHDYMHHFARDLIQNVDGDGHIGTIGSFIAKVLY